MARRNRRPLKPILISLALLGPGAFSLFALPSIASAAPLGSTIPVGMSPDAIAYDPANGDLYVANDGSANVSVINVTVSGANVVASIPVGLDPRNVTVDPLSGMVWVVNYLSSNISLISGTTSAGSITPLRNGVPVPPVYSLYNPANHEMYVSIFTLGSGTGLVYAYNAATNALVARIALVNSSAGVLGYDPSNGGIYVFSAKPGSETIYFINSGNTVAATIPDRGGSVQAFAFDPSDQNMYAADAGRGVVLGINSTTNTISSFIFANGADALVYDPAMRDMVVANGRSNSVSFFTQCCTSSTKPTGTDPDALAYMATSRIYPNGSLLVANVGSGNVTIIIPGALNSYAYVGLDPTSIVYVNRVQYGFDTDTGSNTVSAIPNSNGHPPSATYWIGLGPVSGPAGRSDAGMTYIDNSTAEFILDGGLDSSGHVLGDTWLLKGGSWTQVCPTTGCANGPSPRWGASLVYGDNWVLLFGGCTTNSRTCSTALNDTWSFNTATNFWSRVYPNGPTPPPRFDQTMSSRPGLNLAVLFGGEQPGGIALNDTYEIAKIIGIFTWGKPTTVNVVPNAGWGGAMSYLFRNDTQEFVMFGGTDASGNANSNTFVFTHYSAGIVTGGYWTQIPTGAHPPPLWGASMSYTARNGEDLLFGGYNTSRGGAPYGDTWMFDGNNWNSPYINSTSPSARFHASIAYVSSQANAYLFFGYNPSSGVTYNDEWVFV